MHQRSKDYKNFVRRLKRKMIGEQCEDRRCGRRMDTMQIMQVNHLVRRSHCFGPNAELYTDRANLRVCCFTHGSPEDFKRNGEHTTPSERIEMLCLRYGVEAARWAEDKMMEVGVMAL